MIWYLVGWLGWSWWALEFWRLLVIPADRSHWRILGVILGPLLAAWWWIEYRCW